MKMKNKLSRAGATLLFFVASFLFFDLCLDGHLHYREWFQLWLSTPEYFSGLFSAPGGFAAWLARFLTQFSSLGWLGALVCAALLTAIQLFVAMLSKARSGLAYALSFLPSGCLWVMLCIPDYNLVSTVSVFLCLVSACLIRHIRNDKSRSMAVIALSPVLWWLCGPFAFIFPAAFVRNVKWWAPLLGVLLVICCPFVFFCLVPYDLRSLMVGVFYSGLPWTVPVLLWVCALVAASVLIALSFELPRGWFFALPAYIVISALVVAGIFKFSNFRIEQLFDYSQLVYEGEWKKVIDRFRTEPVTSQDVHLETTTDGPKWDISNMYILRYSCAALSYAKQGRLVENLFTRFCPGQEGLFPPYDKTKSYKSIFLSDVYYHLAMTSQSQEVMFEDMESIPDKQKSSRAYQRLAEANSINNRFPASQKYLDALSHTLTYSEYARTFNHDSEQIREMRRKRYRGETYAHNVDAVESALLDLVRQCPDNRMAAQYLVATILLKKELKYLDQVINETYVAQGATTAPDAVQQAMLCWLVSRDDFSGQAPEFVSDENKKLGIEFNTEFEKLKELPESKVPAAINELRRKYGKTYYFYYYLQ